MNILFWVVVWVLGSAVAYFVAGAADEEEGQYWCCPLLPFWPFVLMMCLVILVFGWWEALTNPFGGSDTSDDYRW